MYCLRQFVFNNVEQLTQYKQSLRTGPFVFLCHNCLLEMENNSHITGLQTRLKAVAALCKEAQIKERAYEAQLAQQQNENLQLQAELTNLKKRTRQAANGDDLASLTEMMKTIVDNNNAGMLQLKNELKELRELVNIKVVSDNKQIDTDRVPFKPQVKIPLPKPSTTQIKESYALLAKLASPPIAHVIKFRLIEETSELRGATIAAIKSDKNKFLVQNVKVIGDSIMII